MSEQSTLETTMKRYCVGFMFDRKGNVALVRKTKPAWQAGYLNGIGGKLEDGESPANGMVREWLEETGIPHGEWDEFSRTTWSNEAIVFFFRSMVEELPKFPSHNDVGEPIEVHAVDHIPQDQLINNLKYLIPMALDLDLVGAFVVSR